MAVARRLARLHTHTTAATSPDQPPSPFRLHVPEAELVDLRRRLHCTRWPDQLAPPANDGWAYGAELGYVRELAAYWERDFDWRAAEAKFNAMPQFTLRVRGLSVHFVHQRCTTREDAPALLLTHGWPGSVFEFHKVLAPLAEHFHVVAPSIAGYGFSEAPRARGFSAAECARSEHALMQALGYGERYFAQGGDWGAVVTRCLGVLFPAHCVAIHVNMAVVGPPKGFDVATLSEAEAAGVARTALFQRHGTGYQAIQKTRPQTLAYGLTDSPVGLLAWIVEKFFEWSDRGDAGAAGAGAGAGQREWGSAHSKDDLLTNVMLYWASKSIGPSMRFYYETLQGMPGTSKELGELGMRFVTVPTAIAVFPSDIFVPPRAWCEQSFNVCRFTAFASGGHFAALERPDEFVSDVTQFFVTEAPRCARREE